jgi:hypothetical protein
LTHSPGKGHTGAKKKGSGEGVKGKAGNKGRRRASKTAP